MHIDIYMYVHTCIPDVCTYMYSRCMHIHVFQMYVHTCIPDVCTYMYPRCMYIHVSQMYVHTCISQAARAHDLHQSGYMRVCDMICSYEGRDVLIYLTWLINEWRRVAMVCIRVSICVCVTWLIHVRDVTYWCIWYDLLISEGELPWFASEWVYVCVWHDSFMKGTWRMRITNMPRFW